MQWAFLVLTAYQGHMFSMTSRSSFLIKLLEYLESIKDYPNLWRGSFIVRML